jgi:protein-S-isoprenylcysteine O-methyltransferase Ste14
MGIFSYNSNRVIKISFEDPELEKRLGSEYAEYKRRVPMFFPKFGGRKYK